MGVAYLNLPTHGDSFAVSLHKLNKLLVLRGGTGVNTLAPTGGDSVVVSLKKICQILAQRNPAVPKGPFPTLLPKQGDSKETVLRKINQIYYAGGS